MKAYHVQMRHTGRIRDFYVFKKVLLYFYITVYCQSFTNYISFLFYSVALILCQIDSEGLFSVILFFATGPELSQCSYRSMDWWLSSSVYEICPLKGESEIRETIINNLKHETQKSFVLHHVVGFSWPCLHSEAKQNWAWFLLLWGTVKEYQNLKRI